MGVALVAAFLVMWMLSVTSDMTTSPEKVDVRGETLTQERV